MERTNQRGRIGIGSKGGKDLEKERDGGRDGGIDGGRDGGIDGGIDGGRDGRMDERMGEKEDERKDEKIERNRIESPKDRKIFFNQAFHCLQLRTPFLSSNLSIRFDSMQF